MNHRLIDIKLLEPNTGQIPDVPENPRVIRDERYVKLVSSIKDDPELLTAMPVIVFPFGKKFVAIAGNMRLRACRELKFKQVPCVVIPEETPVETIKAYIIKTNVSFGEHDFDLLANHFDFEQLQNYGLVIPDFSALAGIDMDDFFAKDENVAGTLTEKFTIVLEYSIEDGPRVKEALSKINPSAERAVWQLLKLSE